MFNLVLTIDNLIGIIGGLTLVVGGVLIVIFKIFRPNRWADFVMATISISCGVVFVAYSLTDRLSAEWVSQWRFYIFWRFYILLLAPVIFYGLESLALKSFAPLSMSTAEKVKRVEARRQAVIQAILERPKAAYWKLWRSWIINISVISTLWTAILIYFAERYIDSGYLDFWLGVIALLLFFVNVYFLTDFYKLLILRKFSIFKSWVESLLWLLFSLIGLWAGMITSGFIGEINWIIGLSEMIRTQLLLGIGINLIATCLQALMLTRYFRLQEALFLGGISLCGFFIGTIVCGYDYWINLPSDRDLNPVWVSLIGLPFGLIYSTFMGFGFLWILNRTTTREGIIADFPKLNRIFVSSFGLLIFSIVTYTQAPRIYSLAQNILFSFRQQQAPTNSEGGSRPGGGSSEGGAGGDGGGF